MTTLTDKQAKDLTLLLNGGYLPSRLQAAIHVESHRTEEKSMELHRWLSMPECQAALPALRQQAQLKIQMKVRQMGLQTHIPKPKSKPQLTAYVPAEKRLV